jgi:hypothetical protein
MAKKTHARQGYEDGVNFAYEHYELFYTLACEELTKCPDSDDKEAYVEYMGGFGHALINAIESRLASL